MKISFNWLKEYIDTDKSAQEVADILTNIGLEVEGIEHYQSIKGGLEGLVIGQVISKTKHPNADRLSLTTVHIGNGNDLSIVCGAPNVEANQKVVVAPVGCTLHHINGESFEIKKSKIRGELSEGMICAEDEIGMGTDHDGIIVLEEKAEVGKLLKEYYSITEDIVFEIGLTPNRADATSHIGVARDLAVAIKSKVNIPSVEDFKGSGACPIEIEVANNDLCPRYVGLYIKDVKVSESPDWLKGKLNSIGLKPINNIVDITNFVLYETGQPLHAFDAANITGNKVIIKTLPKNTKFNSLDEVERELSDEDLMICNDKEGMCIAGVLGGIDSGITDKTTSIFLESAYFNPATIRKTSKRHGLQTDASFRFERGADPNITVYAAKRAALLIQEISGGTISEIIDVYPTPIENFTVEFSLDQLSKISGEEINKQFVITTLKNLDIEIIKDSNNKLTLSVPPKKVDVQREIDIIEEILRIYGYNNIKIPAKLNTSISYAERPDNLKVKNTISNFLVANGFYETISSSLTNPIYSEQLGNPDEAVKVLNPLSKELDTLRQSMLYSGLESIRHNINRQANDLKFFEFGKSYNKQKNHFIETPHLALFTTGKKHKINIHSKNIDGKIYYLKACVKNILDCLGLNYHESYTGKYTLLNQYIEYQNSENKILAIIGQVEKKALQVFDIDQEVFYGELDWQLLMQELKNKSIEYAPVPKFPAVRRDLALLIDKDIPFADIKKIAINIDNEIIKSVDLFDIYEGKQIPEGKKSYAISIVLQNNNKTLTDAEVDQVIDKLVKRYSKEINAEIR